MAEIEIKGTIVSDDDIWIYDHYEMAATAPAKVKAAIKEAKKTGEALNVRINSGGGDLHAGIEIYDALKAYGKANIHVGYAYSAASIIMCAGKSTISRSGMVMIHNVSGAASGDHNALDTASRALSTADKAVAAAYAEKSGRPLEEWLEKMNAETWLTADEAVELGLIDRISIAENGSLKLTAAYADVIPENIITAMRNKRKEDNARAQLALLKLRGGKR